MNNPSSYWQDINEWAAQNGVTLEQAKEFAMGSGEIEFSAKGDGGYVRYSACPIIKGKLKKISKSDQQRDSIWPEGMEPPPIHKTT